MNEYMVSDYQFQILKKKNNWPSNNHKSIIVNSVICYFSFTKILMKCKNYNKKVNECSYGNDNSNWTNPRTVFLTNNFGLIKMECL